MRYVIPLIRQSNCSRSKQLTNYLHIIHHVSIVQPYLTNKSNDTFPINRSIKISIRVNNFNNPLQLLRISRNPFHSMHTTCKTPQTENPRFRNRKMHRGRQPNSFNIREPSLEPYPCSDRFPEEAFLHVPARAKLKSFVEQRARTPDSRTERGRKR